MPILILLIALISPARADFIASIGGEVGSSGESEAKNAAGEHYLKHDTPIGFRAEFELKLINRLFITASAGYWAASSKVQYDYTDKDDETETATIEGMPASFGALRGMGGLRFRLVHAKRFRMFVGGGAQFGAMLLAYDEEQFEDRNNDEDTGYLESEAASFGGPFAEVGMDFILTDKYGLRMLAQQTWHESKRFETLDNNEIKGKVLLFSINYIQYFETNSR